MGDPIDGSPPGSSAPGILQARTLEWAAISFSNAWKWNVWKWSHSVVSNSSQPHGLQPTRLLHPWDFPAKSTEIQMVSNKLWHYAKTFSHPKQRYVNWGEVKVTQSWPTLCNPMDYTSPWNFPGKNIRVGSLSLLQGMSPTQGSNPGLSHCRQILYQLSHHFIYHQEIQMVLNKLWHYAKIFSYPKYREINNTKKISVYNQ